MLAREYRCSTRDRNARTGTFREQWAAPPRTSVKDRDGVPQKGPSEGAIPLPDVAWLHSPIHGLGTGW